ncbi:hypothetical protein FRX31_025631, partial [Thalictrum thalictroides]
MVTGYVNVADYGTALEFVRIMKRDGFCFDQYTFGSVLKGIACLGVVDLGKQVHSVIVKTGYERNVFSGFAQMGEAFRLLGCMEGDGLQGLQ